MNFLGHYILGSNMIAYHLALAIQHLNPKVDIVFILDPNFSLEKLPNIDRTSTIKGNYKSLFPHLNPKYQFTITIDTLSSKTLADIYQSLQNHGFKRIAFLPNLHHIPPSLSWLNNQQFISEHFLNRPLVSFSLNEHLVYLNKKNILITGAGGSIGSELSKEIIKAKPNIIYLLGHGETSIYNIEKELNTIKELNTEINTKIHPVIGEIQDLHYLCYLIEKIKPHIIFHCAAHKHVPLMELNPIESIKNNVFGVHYLIEAAKKHSPERFILISTDKAVMPENLYGVSKALGEEIVFQANKEGYPFFIVRFGNVLGSRGSILPLFQEQILKGGPITITDKRMRRYWMTIPEATSLVLIAASIQNPQALYLLDMGCPINIITVAKQMAKIYGYNLDNKDIPVKYIGMRHGETLEEQLVAPHESITPTSYPKLMQINKEKEMFNKKSLQDFLLNLQDICFFNAKNNHNFRSLPALLNLLKKFFPQLKSEDTGNWL